jgi:4-hydroxymandelate oxidase
VQGRRLTLNRRTFIGGIAVLPALWSRATADDSPPPSRLYQREAPPITSAEQVLNVADFEPLARVALPPAHFGYIATGADDDRTVIRNHEAYSHYEIRAHRFTDLRHMDTTRRVFGSPWRSPIYLSAVSGMRAFHSDAEVAAAHAAATRSMQLMLSTASSTAVETVGEARGARNNETLKRAMTADSRHCVDCHVGNSHDMWRNKPMFSGLDVSRVTALAPADLSGGYLDRLRAIVKGRLLVKGVVAGDDAAFAVKHGVDGIVVSNHGGRNEETLRASIDCLPEVVDAVKGRVPIFVDGGIRRGTDVFKALALGATAVGIGRPQVWGLAAFGQSGIEAVIDILDRELNNIMRQAGTPTLARITPQHLVRSRDG